MTWGIEQIRNVRVRGVDDATLGEIRVLLEVQRNRFAKNYQRTLYCDTEQQFKDLGIALPPQLNHVKYVLGWADQAVRKPSMRSQFDGFRLAGTDDPFELGEILEANAFPLEFGQAVYSAARHGVSLVTVAHGFPGEADVQVIAHSAESSAAVWDRRKRRLRSALTISDTDQDGDPSEFRVYLTDRVVTCVKVGKEWVADTVPNPTGRVMAVPVRHDPQLTRQMGRSRLTNSVMRLSDIAVRTIARMESNAEFYSSPQIALMGADEEAFEGTTRAEKFRLAMDRLIAVSKDEDGDAPTLQQLSQATMTPHSDMYRTVVMAFCGETGLSPGSLGLVHDQPASAEAIRAAEHDLLIDVTYQNRFVLSSAAKDIAALMLLTRDGSIPDEFWKMSAQFNDPEFRSLSAESDATQKLAASMGDLAKYPVLLERIFSQSEVERIQADANKASVGSFLEGLSTREQSPAVQQAMSVRGSGDPSTTGDGNVPGVSGSGDGGGTV